MPAEDTRNSKSSPPWLDVPTHVCHIDASQESDLPSSEAAL